MKTANDIIISLKDYNIFKEQALYNGKKLKPLTSPDVYTYVYLKNKISNKDNNITLDYEFQYVFNWFYGMNSAGLTDKFKEIFFDLMQNLKSQKLNDFFNYNNFKDLIEEPTSRQAKKIKEKIEIPKQIGSCQFSFISKLCNIIDDTFPIYDSYINSYFEINIEYNANKEVRFNNFRTKMIELKELYKKIEKDEYIQDLIKKFDEKFTEIEVSSNIKKLDFIFWATGKNA